MIKDNVGPLATRWLRQNFRYSVEDAEEFATASDWSGFEFVEGSGGEPLVVPSDYRISGHTCEHLLDTSNAQQATELIASAANEEISGAVVWEFAGALAYDWGNPAAREAAESIGNRLSDYPVLSDEDFSEREHESAREILIDCHKVPEDIADDVVSAILRDGQSLCPECGFGDVDTVMSGLGYTECAECGEWLKTTLSGSVCFDCADSYTYAEGDAVRLVIDTARHIGVYPSKPALEDAEEYDNRDDAEDDDPPVAVDPDQTALF